VGDCGEMRSPSRVSTDAASESHSILAQRHAVLGQALVAGRLGLATAGASRSRWPRRSPGPSTGSSWLSTSMPL
jgi:hypothetical protein